MSPWRQFDLPCPALVLPREGEELKETQSLVGKLDTLRFADVQESTAIQLETLADTRDKC